MVGEADPKPCSVLAALCSPSGLERSDLVVGRAATAGCGWEKIQLWGIGVLLHVTLASGFVRTWSIVGAAFLDGVTALRGSTP